jgi:phage shock protein PspC (stress-responsive transcriptional regulator)
MEPKRLYRSLVDKKIGGVAGGIADYFEIDPLLIRLLFVILTLAGGGGVLIYIILWIVTPEQPYIYTASRKSPNPGPSYEGNTNESGSTGNQQDTNSQPFEAHEIPPVETLEKPRQRGSLIGGMVLITIGSLFLADEMLPNFDFGDFWPVILIVVGGGLLFKAIIKKEK